MLIIRPIQEKTAQEAFCRLCEVPYFEECLAYAAYVAGEFIGISQFSVSDDYGSIETLVTVPKKKDAEALFIMGRQTMNWIDLLGIHTCRIRRDAGPANVIRAMGFETLQEDGYLYVDMTGMFDGHCGGNCHVADMLREGESND